jgi:hypothetical protein
MVLTLPLLPEAVLHRREGKRLFGNGRLNTRRPLLFSLATGELLGFPQLDPAAALIMSRCCSAVINPAAANARAVLAIADTY